ncbi:MAG: YgiQ family radical SAM protein [Deltaproteobacteria bacterium]|nr:YgiQ family radical SAM protein [Deltaproteobacteria bacterium]
MFIPSTKEELTRLGWKGLDVILVSGDAYIDSPFVGVSVVGKVLMAAGYKVGIIGQPALDTDKDIMRLGEPKLFWGVTAGCIDSMVANRTASGKKRKADDYTPGGVNDKRPDRAAIAYSNLIQRFRRDTSRPIVLGGIEASLRRVSHYDFWTDRVRGSVLFDAKADYLLYGMAEGSARELANCLKNGGDPSTIRGLCYISKTLVAGSIEMPSFEETRDDKKKFLEAFRIFYSNNDPVTAKALTQRHGVRYLVQNPPAPYVTGEALDKVYNLEYERELHPVHRKDGEVKVLETIRFAVSTHRGCYGECAFCAIAVHEGRRVRSRSRASIVKEVEAIAKHPRFKGMIHDVGGPSANMYASDCARMEKKGCCADKSCVSPEVCPALKQGHDEQIELLKAVRAVSGVKKAVVASGIRYDMVLADKKCGEKYLKEIVTNHVSGQLKIAPEHSEQKVLGMMAKPGCGRDTLVKFKDLFFKFNKEAGLRQFLSYYFIAAHPGCTEADMKKLKDFAVSELGVTPEQTQLFTPAPATISTAMYWAEKDMDGNTCFVEKTFKGREGQKEALVGNQGGAERAKGPVKGRGRFPVRGRR